ncbi:zinc finger CCCH domain-containing protein 65-like [Eutrema salsugineum]|uniref:zinc finger CCCH domain-containing protein 65-like n=1 Tax=Eutrema salsugineum TaxID=72664 RepID=UPI000CED556E|nr:zinc finger CCCH domain-containing protein 65-like [Eutrema salsugineum]
MRLVGTPQAASDTPSAITAASFSPQKSNKQTVREAIAKLPTIQARVSIPDMFLKPSSQANQRNSSDASPPQIPPLRKPSVAPKGMSFLSLEKTSQEDTVKPPSLGSKQNTQNSDNQSLKQSQQRSSVPMVPPKGISLTFASEKHKSLNQEPQESASSKNLKTTPNSHIQSSLNSTMKLAAEFESAKVERRTNDPAEAVKKGDVAVNTSVTRNSGNIPSKILEFLSSFSHGKN